MKTYIYDDLLNCTAMVTLDDNENYLTIEGKRPAHFTETEMNCSKCILANYQCGKIPCEPHERKDGKRGVYRYISPKNKQSHGNI